MHGVPFIDRARELALLEDEWRRPGLRVAIVYGRRRVGKTRLLLEWLRRRRGAYCEAVELSYPQLAMGAGEAISRQLGVPVSQRDLVEALEQLAAATRGERVAVVLDEFQYIAEAGPLLAQQATEEHRHSALQEQPLPGPQRLSGLLVRERPALC